MPLAAKWRLFAFASIASVGLVVTLIVTLTGTSQADGGDRPIVFRTLPKKTIGSGTRRRMQDAPFLLMTDYSYYDSAFWQAT